MAERIISKLLLTGCWKGSGWRLRWYDSSWSRCWCSFQVSWRWYQCRWRWRRSRAAVTLWKDTIGRLDLNALRIIGIVVPVTSWTRIAAITCGRTFRAPVLETISAPVLRRIREALTVIRILNHAFITKNTIRVCSAVTTCKHDNHQQDLILQEIKEYSNHTGK